MTDNVSTHQAEDDARNEAILIYVNGQIVPKAQAMVSVYDSGFMLGDGVWEGIRLYNGTWSFLDEHLDRLFEAAKAVDIDIGLTRAQLAQAVFDTQAANGMTSDAHARLMVTRGVKTRPFQHPKLSQRGPTVVIIMEHSRPKLPRPIRLATVPHMRGLPMTQDPKLNSHSKLNCITACIQATQAGADEALMLDPHGFVAPCNSTHFFIVKKNRRGVEEVWTSSGDYCLAGITRGNVIAVCEDNGIPVFQKNFSLTDVYSASEAFVTGTLAGVVPVTGIDGRTLTDARGPMVARLQGLYRALIEADVTARGRP